MNKDMWNPLDKITQDFSENFANIEKDIECAICSENVTLPFYSFKKQSDERASGVDVCSDCFPNKLDKLFKFNEIDRTTFSIEDKPLIWKCLYCDTKLGGGCKWHIFNLNYQTYDVCNMCYPTINAKLENDFHAIDDKYVLCVRSDCGVYLDISDVKNRVIPNYLIHHVTEERIKSWAECIDAVVHIDINETSFEFGSIKSWGMFTDFYELPFFDAQTALLVDCSMENNGRIASIVMDDHGRFSIDLIFNNLDDYVDKYNDWKNNKLDDDTYHNIYSDVEKKIKSTYFCEEDELANICKEFSGFIRLKRKLKIYYG